MAYFEVRDNFYKRFSSGMACQAARHKDLNFRAHWHNEIELTLVCEGSITMGINSDCTVLKKNDIAICTSGCIHYYETIESSSIIIVLFRPELINSIIGIPANTTFIYPFINEDTLKVLDLDPEIIDAIRSCFHKICDEYFTKEGHYQPMIKSYLVQIMGLLLRHIPQCYMNPNINYKGAMRHIGKIQKAIQYIEDNYSENITLEEISQLLGLSPFYLSKIFKMLTGQTFKSYLNNIRVQNAEKMILSSSKPIIDIALDSGFNSLRTFNRVYKNIRHKTPSSLRKI